MLEIPEAVIISKQIAKSLKGKIITDTIAGTSPHKFAWYQGESDAYPALLNGKSIIGANPVGGMVEVSLDGAKVVFSEGASPVFYEAGTAPPKKHQLLLNFTDGSFLAASVRMYGGLLAFKDGEAENEWYLIAKKKISPITGNFDQAYFEQLIGKEAKGKLSLKAFLATEQRIPGLGNGTLQDILYNAGLHPKRKIASLEQIEKASLFRSIIFTLTEMVKHGGRDTEFDFFRQHGGYKTKCSKNTVGTACGKCGSTIEKASYMGGSIYFCSSCQPL